MSGINIVHAGPDAAELLASLHARSFDGGEVWDRAAFESLLGGMGVEARVAAKDAVPLGFILIRTIADQMEILTLAVLPSARRSGIGRALVEAGLQGAQARGARTAFLEVSVNNGAAIALYRAAGWGEAGRRLRYYTDGSDALILSRDV
ncbi:MAG: ribosomal-protein-alanine N-acetyltransferase RimI [Oceanicaulis sp. HLUCCA04]|nr:MAG: ribosomal-protein-alanine N-acetyltransferase RimI [Oceanicaulis sp. HLUCCA04]